MGLIDIFIKKKRERKLQRYIEQERANFDIEAYNKFNNEKIKEFTDKYDLSTKDGIQSISITEATKYPDANVGVVYMPEQILMRKATEYKKAKNFELAIECLKKANELLEYSPFAYTRDNYERLVDMMVLAGKYDEARIEHQRLDFKLGTRIDEFHRLQDYAVSTNVESKEEYQHRVIDPYIEESKDRKCYYWFLEKIPSIAPKSFGGFRNMKNKNSDNYKKIIDAIRKKGFEVDQIKFWIN